MKYYSPANQYSDLWSLAHIYRKSCALTLADKHKLRTASKAYKIFGPNLKVSDPLDPKKTVKLFYPESLKTTSNFKIGIKYIHMDLLGEDPIEGNHK